MVAGLHWYHNPPSHALQALAGAIAVRGADDKIDEEGEGGHRLQQEADRLAVGPHSSYLLELQYHGLPAAASATVLDAAEQSAAEHLGMQHGGDRRRRRRRRLDEGKVRETALPICVSVITSRYNSPHVCPRPDHAHAMS